MGARLQAARKRICVSRSRRKLPGSSLGAHQQRGRELWPHARSRTCENPQLCHVAGLFRHLTSQSLQLRRLPLGRDRLLRLLGSRCLQGARDAGGGTGACRRALFERSPIVQWLFHPDGRAISPPALHAASEECRRSGLGLVLFWQSSLGKTAALWTSGKECCAASFSTNCLKLVGCWLLVPTTRSLLQVLCLVRRKEVASASSAEARQEAR